MFLKSHRFYRWFLKNFWAYQSQKIQKVWKKRVVAEVWPFESQMDSRRWVGSYQPFEAASHLIDQWHVWKVWLVGFSAPIWWTFRRSAHPLHLMQSSDDVDFLRKFSTLPVFFLKHVGSVGLLTGWKHLRWRGCHTIWYFQHGGGSVNLACRFITGITRIRIDHVTHFLMWGNSSTSECSDGRMQGQGGLRCQGKGLGLPKSPQAPALIISAEASSPLFEEVDADSPFPGAWEMQNAFPNALMFLS